MIIDNKLTSSKATLAYWIFALLIVILFVWAFAITTSNLYFFLGLGILALSLYIVLALSKPHYFAFKDSGDKLTFRFYNTHPFFMKPQAIEIHKKLLAKYEMKKSLGGLRKEIILHQKTPKGVATYPPISVRALGPQQWQKLDKALKTQVTYALKFKNKF